VETQPLGLRSTPSMTILLVFFDIDHAGDRAGHDEKTAK
jgi:hypothetical protein